MRKKANTQKPYIPYEVRFYSHLMIILGVFFSGAVLYGMDTSFIKWETVGLLGALTFIFLLRPFLILSNNIAYFLDDIPIYAAIFTLGTQSTFFVILIGFILFEVYKTALKTIKGSPLDFKIFYLSCSNLSQIIISSCAASILFNLVNKGAPLNASFLNITAVAVCAACKFFLNALESTFSSYLCDQKQTFLQIWKKSFSGIWVHLLMLAPLGFTFAYLASYNPLLSLFLVIPVVVLYYACTSFKKTLDHTNKIFQTLVKSIDKRDHYTFGHSQRVASYAKAIAEEIGLNKDDALTVERAGKIHDLGKIALSDDILQKTGKLNNEEVLIMRAHPSMSLAIFKNLSNLKKHIPAEIASMHHERYDGTGYTLGIKGGEIPLTSRILAVADTFDAMTSERVYQKKISFEEAVKKIGEVKETQLDPKLVDAFMKLYKKGALEAIKSRWEFSEIMYKKILKSEEVEEKFLALKQIFN